MFGVSLAVVEILNLLLEPIDKARLTACRNNSSAADRGLVFVCGGLSRAVGKQCVHLDFTNS